MAPLTARGARAPHLARFVLRLQGLYYLGTGLWPVIHLRSFERTTGPKTDDWLVITVGVLAAAVGAVLLHAGRRRHPGSTGRWLGVAVALAFAGVDAAFALSGTIADIYLLDAVVQVAFVAAIAATWDRDLSADAGPGGRPAPGRRP